MVSVRSLAFEKGFSSQTDQRNFFNLTGRTYTLKGRLIAPPSSSDVPATLAVSLRTQSYSRWAVQTFTETKDEDGAFGVDLSDDVHFGINSDVSDVLENVIKAIKGLSRYTYSTPQSESTSKIEKLLEKEPNPNSNDEILLEAGDFGRDSWDYVSGTSRFYSFERQLEDVITDLVGNSASKSYDFQLNTPIPDDAFPTLNSSISAVASSLKFNLKSIKAEELACLRLRKLKKEGTASEQDELLNCDSSDETYADFHQELSDWVTGHLKWKSLTQLWEKVFVGDSEGACKWGCLDPDLETTRHVGHTEVRVTPKIWSQPKRSRGLDEKLSRSGLWNSKYPPFHYSEESNYARAPFFVQGSEGELSKAVDLLVEESQHHQSIRKSGSSIKPSDPTHLDALLPVLDSVSLSSTTAESFGTDEWMRKEMGVDYDPDDEDYVFAPKIIRLQDRKLLGPLLHHVEVTHGSGSSDIGLSWYENVMLKIVEERMQGDS